MNLVTFSPELTYKLARITRVNDAAGIKLQVKQRPTPPGEDWDMQEGGDADDEGPAADLAAVALEDEVELSAADLDAVPGKYRILP